MWTDKPSKDLVSALRHVFRTPKHIGDGQKRAAARLNVKREANADIPSAYKYTRQQDRARMRAMKKELRASRKVFMKEEGLPGGPAVVR